MTYSFTLPLIIFDPEVFIPFLTVFGAFMVYYAWRLLKSLVVD